MRGRGHCGHLGFSLCGPSVLGPLCPVSQHPDVCISPTLPGTSSAILSSRNRLRELPCKVPWQLSQELELGCGGEAGRPHEPCAEGKLELGPARASPCVWSLPGKAMDWTKVPMGKGKPQRGSDRGNQAEGEEQAGRRNPSTSWVGADAGKGPKEKSAWIAWWGGGICPRSQGKCAGPRWLFPAPQVLLQVGAAWRRNLLALTCLPPGSRCCLNSKGPSMVGAPFES